ncbi:MAG: hypothetical protein LBU80_06205 [Rikenellaceae bacterium]|jgi:hypothetical protein|nr:hypothetical protein [Rikenellaceae bacterium]
MKANIFAFLTALLLLPVMFAGCNNANDDELPEDKILPVLSNGKIETGGDGVLANEELTAFFEKYLPTLSGSQSECFFVGDKENKCLIINSADELRKIISSSSVELPTIDFGSYTLVMGQHMIDGTAYRVVTQEIAVNSDKKELTLSVKKPDGTYTVICPVYYWGLYPKLTQEAIGVNLIIL